MRNESGGGVARGLQQKHLQFGLNTQLGTAIRLLPTGLSWLWALLGTGTVFGAPAAISLLILKVKLLSALAMTASDNNNNKESGSAWWGQGKWGRDLQRRLDLISGLPNVDDLSRLTALTLIGVGSTRRTG